MNSMATFALAWKEFRQVAGISIAISICAILGFVAAIVLENIAPLGNPIEFFYSIVPATLTPITIAMAGAVISVGGEKQSGNWQWLTTLPVTWLQAFFTKLAVLCLMSLGSGFVVYLVTYGISAIANSTLSYEMGLDGYDYRLMLFALPTALFWAMIMCLCFREPMIAIMIAAGITLLQGLFNNILLSEFVSNSAPTDFGTMAIVTSIESLFLFVVTISCFRIGWWNHEPIFENILNSRVRIDSVDVATRWGTWSKPNYAAAMLWQSVQAQFWPVVITAILTMIAYPLFGFHVETLIANLIMFLAAIMGVFTLSSEQTRRQYRFVADRGLSPRLYLFMRIIVPILLIAVTTFGIIPILHSNFGPPRSAANHWLIYLGMFGCSLGIYLSFVLAALSFSNPLLAIFAGIAATGTLCYGVTAPYFSGGFVGLWASIPLCLIGMALPWLLVTRWMRYETSKLHLISIASVAAISLTALTVHAPLRAFSIPKVDVPSFNSSLAFEALPANLTNVQFSRESYIPLLNGLKKIKKVTGAHTQILERLEAISSTSDLALNANDSPTDTTATSDASTDSNTANEIQRQLEKLGEEIESQVIRSVDYWHYRMHGTAAAEWLSFVIYYALETENEELLSSAVDIYATLVDPRYPIEFSLYDASAFSYLLAALRDSGKIGSPKLYAIVFDRLARNVPNPEIWSNYYIAYAKPEINAFAKNHSYFNPDQFPLLNRRYPADYSGETERFYRVNALTTGANIERAVPIVREMAQIQAANQETIKKDLTSVRRTATGIELCEVENYYFQAPEKSEVGQILMNYYAEFYGTMSFYPMHDNASGNLRLYFSLIHLAAQGTQPD